MGLACVSAAPLVAAAQMPAANPTPVQSPAASIPINMNEFQAATECLTKNPNMMECVSALTRINTAIPLYKLDTKPLIAAFIANSVFQTYTFHTHFAPTVANQPQRAGPFMLTETQYKEYLVTSQDLVNQYNIYLQTVPSVPANPILNFLHAKE